MSNISLRVCIYEKKIVKTIILYSRTNVSEVCSIIRQKIPEARIGDEKDYGIFKPDTDKDLDDGFWIDCGRDLAYYGLANGDLIVYRKKYRSLKVSMLDGSVKTCSVDDSQPVANLMVMICFKLGITNSDEYGLIRLADGSREVENYYINNYNTLTMRRRTKEDNKERDAELDTLRKKIKTDDEVNWIDSGRTLREQGIGENERVLLKRKFFFSDRNIDSHDPVQLNLLYVQTRDGITNGTHPVTRETAAVLAGYQCQIEYGDFDERKSEAPYFFHNLKDFLPESYVKIRGMDKRILSEYAKHRGREVLDVKLSYVKTCRALPTYGVTFYLVKEKMKGKNKLVPRLLGVNKDSILRLDEKTKEILKAWPLTTVRRWGASRNTFTLDFGDYADEYYSVQTCEAEQIASLVAGYIDIIMKKRQSKEHYGMEGEENATMTEDNILPLKAIVYHQKLENLNVDNLVKPVVADVHTEPQQALLSTISYGQQIITTVERELFETIEIPSGIDPTVLKWREERNVTSHLAAMNAATAQVVTLTSTTREIDFTAVGDAISTITTGLPHVSKGVRTLAALTDREGGDKLLDATKKLCGAFSDLLSAAEPESKQPRQNLLNAASRIGDATDTLMNEIVEENESLKDAQVALLNMGKDVAKKTAALVLRGKSVASTLDDRDERTRAIEEATKCALSTSQLVACAKVVAPTIESTVCREQLVTAVREVSSTVESLVEFCNESCKDQQLLTQLSDSARDVTATLNSLLHHINQFSNGYHTNVAVYNEFPTVHQNTSVEKVQVTSERVIGIENNIQEISDCRFIIQSECSETLQERLISAAKNLADATAQMAYSARA